MELKDLIREYQNKNGVSASYIAEQLGVTRSTVARWLSGDVKKVQGAVKEKIDTLLGYDIDVVLNGTVLEFKKPILGYAKAGYDMFAQENFLGYEEVTYEYSKKGDYYLKIVGDSMTGARIHDGDLVYVKQCQDVNNGDIAVVLIGDDEVTVKRIQRKNDLLILEAANPDVENRYFSLKDVEDIPVRIIGKVLYSKTVFE